MNMKAPLLIRQLYQTHHEVWEIQGYDNNDF
jgi:hypothetical protein